MPAASGHTVPVSPRAPCPSLAPGPRGGEKKRRLERDAGASPDRDAGLVKPSLSGLNVAASRHEKLQRLELQIIYF